MGEPSGAHSSASARTARAFRLDEAPRVLAAARLRTRGSRGTDDGERRVRCGHARLEQRLADLRREER